MDYIGRYFLQAAKDFMGYEVGFFRICQKNVEVWIYSKIQGRR